MPSLSSLIVQRQVATVEEVEQAIARQVIHGGDLVTNLLEVAPRTEILLGGLIAETAGIPAAPSGRLPAPEGELLDAIPAELALGHAFFPLRREGDALVIASPAALVPAVKANLEENIGARIIEYAAPMIRVREAIAAQYGIPLDTRMLRLVAKLERAATRAIAGASEPPSSREDEAIAPRALPKAPSIAPSTFASGVPGSEDAWESEDRVSVIESLPPTRAEEEAPVVSFSEAAYAEPSETPEEPNGVPASGEPEQEPHHELELAALTERAPEVLRHSKPPPSIDDSPPPSSVLHRRAALGLVHREARSQRKESKSARRKGPFARADAERELDEAKTADQIIDVFFAFGSQYFQYSALFRVHGDIAEGRDAFGPGATRDKVLTLGIPLDLPSSFQLAKTRGTIVLTKMNQQGLDTDIVSDLGRARSDEVTRVAAIVPLALKGRTVALLYGDDAETDVTISEIGDLVGFGALAAKNLERIALTKKLGHAPPKVRPASGVGTPRTASAPRPQISRGAGSVAPPALATAPTELAKGADPSTKPYDEEAFRSSVKGARASVLEAMRPRPPVERVSTLVGQGTTPESVTHPRPNEKGSWALPRDEDDDASRWLAEQGVSPAPPKIDGNAPKPGEKQSMRDSGRIRAPEYMIIPERNRIDESGPRLREMAALGPYAALLMKATQGGIQGEEALSELAREADHSLPKIIAAFPGPLVVDRFRMRDSLPEASQCGPLLKLLVMLRKHALGFMTVRSASTDPEQRFWATHVLGELLFPETGAAILPRLFDDDVMVRRVAKRAAIELVKAGAPGEPFMTTLGHMIASEDEPVHRRAVAIEALGDIRAGSLLPTLIDELDDPNETIVDATRRALLLITRQDLGSHPAEWRTWWNANKHRHRIEWLIDALTHETPSLRRAAGDELKSLTNEYFGYYDDLPPREREKAQQKYREWWQEEGRFRFR